MFDRSVCMQANSEHRPVALDLYYNHICMRLEEIHSNIPVNNIFIYKFVSNQRE
jgi:hypothetical protein